MKIPVAPHSWLTFHFRPSKGYVWVSQCGFDLNVHGPHVHLLLWNPYPITLPVLIVFVCSFFTKFQEFFPYPGSWDTFYIQILCKVSVFLMLSLSLRIAYLFSQKSLFASGNVPILMKSSLLVFLVWVLAKNTASLYITVTCSYVFSWKVCGFVYFTK